MPFVTGYPSPASTGPEGQRRTQALCSTVAGQAKGTESCPAARYAIFNGMLDV
ncbi:hypothetical protein GCM10010372_21560 [Streptomyces tauricus]|nr:hypothetical protein GCM10010372_21560 [Streptomyces tauricus]